MRYFLSAALVIAFAGPAVAMDPITCSKYTEIAMAQVQQAKALKCGFDPNDPRWSENASAHDTWCLGTSEGGVSFAELKEREQALLNCAECRNYANEAMRAAGEASLYCFHIDDPSLWNKDNFSTCMAAEDNWLFNPDSGPNKDARARANAINACKANPDIQSLIQSCNKFVQETQPTVDKIGKVCGYPINAELPESVSIFDAFNTRQKRFDSCMLDRRNIYDHARLADMKLKIDQYAMLCMANRLPGRLPKAATGSKTANPKMTGKKVIKTIKACGADLNACIDACGRKSSCRNTCRAQHSACVASLGGAKSRARRGRSKAGGRSSIARTARPSSSSSKSLVIGPGLLEGDSGFSSQGPAAAGVPRAPSQSPGNNPTYSHH